jgi:hypothetical protein
MLDQEPEHARIDRSLENEIGSDAIDLAAQAGRHPLRHDDVEVPALAAEWEARKSAAWAAEQHGRRAGGLVAGASDREAELSESAPEIFEVTVLEEQGCGSQCGVGRHGILLRASPVASSGPAHALTIDTPRCETRAV